VDRLGKDTLQELRLRKDMPVQLVCRDGLRQLAICTTIEMMDFVVNMACKYSPWSAASQANGYLTAPGGHRIGLCGEAFQRPGSMIGIQHVSSLCIRVARDFPGIGARAMKLHGNLLILGPPGSGKTTLLRDVIRNISNTCDGSVAVVDERCEIFPPQAGFDKGIKTDVLSGCPKALGVDMVLRSMGPGCIALDEITADGDCAALEDAAWCGVRLVATAHACGKQDLFGRKSYQRLVSSGLFDTLLILDKEKNWTIERMEA
jgi:stage III sporulation protein AA